MTLLILIFSPDDGFMQPQDILAAQRAVITAIARHRDLTLDGPGMVGANRAIKTNVNERFGDGMHIP